MVFGDLKNSIPFMRIPLSLLTWMMLSSLKTDADPLLFTYSKLCDNDQCDEWQERWNCRYTLTS